MDDGSFGWKYLLTVMSKLLVWVSGWNIFPKCCKKNNHNIILKIQPAKVKTKKFREKLEKKVNNLLARPEKFFCHHNELASGWQLSPTITPITDNLKNVDNQGR